DAAYPRRRGDRIRASMSASGTKQTCGPPYEMSAFRSHSDISTQTRPTAGFGNASSGAPSRTPNQGSPNRLLRFLPPAGRRNRWLEQDEVFARLAFVEPDDRMTLRCECETFRLAIQIAEVPRIAERS